MFQIVLAVTFGSLVFYMEFDHENVQIKNIPEGIWFAIITMTTVGYGDVVPVTNMGKVTGACCAIMGILCMSFPVPVFVSHFNYLYNMEKNECKLNPEDLQFTHQQQSFVIIIINHIDYIVMC